MIILDSTFLIDYLKKDKKAIDTLSKFLEKNEILATTAINVFEIFNGIYYLDEQKQDVVLAEVSRLLSYLTILELTSDSAASCSRIFAYLRKKGIVIEDTDILISGIAIFNRANKICTRNHSHFSKIPGIQVITY